MMGATGPQGERGPTVSRDYYNTIMADARSWKPKKLTYWQQVRLIDQVFIVILALMLGFGSYMIYKIPPAHTYLCGYRYTIFPPDGDITYHTNKLYILPDSHDISFKNASGGWVTISGAWTIQDHGGTDMKGCELP